VLDVVLGSFTGAVVGLTQPVKMKKQAVKINSIIVLIYASPADILIGEYTQQHGHFITIIV
jgi:hypothetical protein